MLNPHATCWTPGGIQPSQRHPDPAPAQAQESDQPGDQQPGVARLLCLPHEVISRSILSQLQDPRDLLAVRLTCKALALRLAEAPATVDLALLQGGSFGHAKRGSLDQFLLALPRCMPGITRLDLCGSAVEDADLVSLLQHLPQLALLDLNGCHKVTRILPNFIAQAAEDARPRSLRSLNLQRCFQLGPGALSQLLRASGQMALACLCLSHLELASWPWQPNKDAACSTRPGLASTVPEPTCVILDSSPPPPPPPPLPPPCWSSTLRFGHMLAGLARARPAADDSGSQEDSDSEMFDEAERPLRGAIVPACLPTTSLSILALHCCQDFTMSALAAITQLCPRLLFLLLGGSTAALPPVKSGWWPEGRTAQPAPLSGSPATASCRTRSTGSSAGDLRTLAGMWAEVLSSLGDLQAVELTFHPAPFQAAFSAAAAGRWTVWDMVSSTTVWAALTLLSAAPPGQAQPPSASPSAMRLALSCASHCSNSARLTPLHVAARSGDLALMQGLLAVGGGVDARDKGGCSPLFLASEAGHTQCVQRLLAAGAQPLMTNASGESSAYIASLKGHLPVVRALMSSFKQRNIVNWQDASIYSDSWTPLMAAVLSHRHAVALALLLEAAEVHRGGNGARGPQDLVAAVNRYGQNVLHIAARKSSIGLLKVLLSFASSASVTHPDCNGDTPIAVARRLRNPAAAQELLNFSLTRVALVQ